jgi:hypothetical protein
MNYRPVPAKWRVFLVLSASTGVANVAASGAEPEKVASAAPPAASRPPVLIGDGLLADDTPGAPCLPICGFPRLTDPDKDGNLDGFGYEGQRPCIADGTTLALSSPKCDVVPLPDPPRAGPGIFREGKCLPVCSSALTDRDSRTGLIDGWGYERRRNCIVTGSAAALGGLPCDPGPLPFPPGDGIDVVVDTSGKLECRPLCRHPTESDPDGDGFGYEGEQSCIVSTSVPALTGVPCDAPDWPLAPPPPPPPPGDGWRSDYTATMFGEVDCAGFGFDDPGDSDLHLAACVSRGAVRLDEKNRIYFGATGDLSSLWTGAPCRCQGAEMEGVCRTPPACPDQRNCGQCVEVTCNFEGRHSFQEDGVTHGEFCRSGRSVVVQLIDACPHNHPNNPYWCTEARKDHIDISCSAFRELTSGRDIGNIGSINVYARAVDCSVGLGPRTFP